MHKIGFVIPSDSDRLVRGIDVTTQHLYPHLVRLAPEYNCEVITVTSPRDPLASGCDLLHFPNFFLFFPSVPLNIKKPYVITLHDVIRLEYPRIYPPGLQGWFKLQYQKMVLNRARAVFTDSYSSVIKIRQYLHLPHEKIKLVYLAAPDDSGPVSDLKRLNIIKKKYHLPEKFILFNGEIDWNKNLTGLIEVAGQIKIPLVIYGKSAALLLSSPEKFNFSHSELAHLPRLVKLLNQPHVRVLGYVPEPDLLGIFNLATVYCQPSFAEGFGLPVIQALACGTPVACSRTHSLPEIAGDSAVYFDPTSRESMIKTLKHLLTDQSLQKLLSQSGLSQAKKFSWDKTAAETLTVYNQIIK